MLSVRHKQYWIVVVRGEERLTQVQIQGPPRPAITLAAGFTEADVPVAMQIPAGKNYTLAQAIFASRNAGKKL